MTRLWHHYCALSALWIAGVAFRTFMTWPVSITWDNGISSRVEALVMMFALMSIPVGLVIAGAAIAAFAAAAIAVFISVKVSRAE